MTKVAIIEDDSAISQMYRIKFESEDYQVETAENGALGLELIEKFKPDIILLDLMMPQMNGDDMLTILRSKPWGKKVKVVILTNQGESESPEILNTLDVSAYIIKADMTPRQVFEIVKENLATPTAG